MRVIIQIITTGAFVAKKEEKDMIANENLNLHGFLETMLLLAKLSISKVDALQLTDFELQERLKPLFNKWAKDADFNNFIQIQNAPA